MRALCLLALCLLAACAGPAPVIEGTDEAIFEAAPEQVEFWLEASSPGHAAQQAWGLPLSQTWEVIRTTSDAVRAECDYDGKTADPTRQLGACTDHDLGVIFLADGLSSEREAVVLLHEMGHALAGKGHGHIADGCPEDAPGPFVMCAHGSRTPDVTPADRAFVEVARSE